MIDGRGQLRVRFKGSEFPTWVFVNEAWTLQNRVQGLEFWTGMEWVPGEVRSLNGLPTCQASFSGGLVVSTIPTHCFRVWKGLGETFEDCFKWVAMQDLTRHHTVAVHDCGGQHLPYGLLQEIGSWVRSQVTVSSLPSELGFVELETKDDCLALLEWVEQVRGLEVPEVLQKVLRYDYAQFQIRRPLGGAVCYEVQGPVVLSGAVVGTMSC